MNDEQDACLLRYADRDEPLVVARVIGEKDRVRVDERCGGLLEGHAVLGDVRRGLVLIPFEVAVNDRHRGSMCQSTYFDKSADRTLVVFSIPACPRAA
jgi:hypothetical protein